MSREFASCRFTLRTRLLAVMALAALLLAACGGGEEAPEEAGREEPDLAAFCEGAIEAEAAFVEGPEMDEQGNPTEEALEQFRNRIEPLVDQFDENKPEEIESEVDTVVREVREALESGDTSSLETREFFEAETVLDEYVYDNCEFDAKQEFTAVNYAFQGIPQTLSAGRTAFRMDNRGTELHEAVIFRINDNVQQNVQEIFSLPEEQAEQNVEFRNATLANPGTPAFVTADLTPGRYAVVCFIPVGVTSLEQLEELDGEEEGATPSPGASPTGTASPGGTPSPTAAATPTGAASPTAAATPTPTPTETGSPSPGAGGEQPGPPHFTQGMFAEFTVS